MPTPTLTAEECARSDAVERATRLYTRMRLVYMETLQSFRTTLRSVTGSDARADRKGLRAPDLADIYDALRVGRGRRGSRADECRKLALLERRLNRELRTLGRELPLLDRRLTIVQRDLMKRLSVNLPRMAKGLPPVPRPCVLTGDAGDVPKAPRDVACRPVRPGGLPRKKAWFKASDGRGR